MLLIGYEMYRQLSLKRPGRVRKGKKKQQPEEDVEDEKTKPLLEGTITISILNANPNKIWELFKYYLLYIMGYLALILLFLLFFINSLPFI